jgi:hypothetical protein
MTSARPKPPLSPGVRSAAHTGTSTDQLDAVYGHLMPSWEERVREQLDVGDERRAAFAD